MKVRAMVRSAAAAAVFSLLLPMGAGAEKLVFDITWTGIKAGTAVQEVVAGKEETRIVSTARSADWINVFFPVEDRIESTLEGVEASGGPRRFVMKIREGRNRKDREIVFDRPRGNALWIDHIGKSQANVAVTPKTFDTLSVLYHVRSLKLEPGRSVFVDLLDNKKLWNIEVQVLRREKLKTVLGEVETLVVKPLMKSDGIFNRKGEMYIWLTDDRRHVPVKMQSKVKIGSITATLTSASF